MTCASCATLTIQYSVSWKLKPPRCTASILGQMWVICSIRFKRSRACWIDLKARRRTVTPVGSLLKVVLRCFNQVMTLVYMLSFSAHLICLSKTVLSAWIRLCRTLHVGVITPAREPRVAFILDQVVLLDMRPTPFLSPWPLHQHLHHTLPN